MIHRVPQLLALLACLPVSTFSLEKMHRTGRTYQRVRGQTRSGTCFHFSLNHTQEKLELSHSGSPIYKLFFSSEKIKLGDISGFPSHDFCHLHMIYSCPGNDQRKPGSQQRCRVSRARKKVREELFPYSGAATPRLEGIRGLTTELCTFWSIHLLIL